MARDLAGRCAIVVGASSGIGAATAAALSGALSRACLEEEPGGYPFRHSVAIQAVNDSIPGPARRQLHRLVGEALDGQAGTSAAGVMHHFKQGGELDKWGHHA